MGLFDFFKKNNSEVSKLEEIKINTNIVEEKKDRIKKERPFFTEKHIDFLAPNEVFVFGSNLAGHHKGGAAQVALNKFGAIWGQGIGFQGQSYAIPTMQGGVETIKPYVNEFITFAKDNPLKFFLVTRIGCGIAGFKDEQIAPLFKDALILSNICLPESFYHILIKPQIHENYKVMEYGQVRTLADIVMVLNEEHNYKSLEGLMTDFNETVKKYIQRGTIPFETYDVISSILEEYEHTLFEEGRLNISRLERIMNDKDIMYQKLELVFHKRSTAKLLRIIQYLNEFRGYSNPNQLISDLQTIFFKTSSFNMNILNDSFQYPLFFFEQSIKINWNKIAPNNTLENDILEKQMFGHVEFVNKYGLDAVIEMNYFSDGPCHPEVYFPREVGTGPIYVKQAERSYVKSCGEGKGPNAHPDLYEYRLIEPILQNDSNYEFLNRHYIPKSDFSKPIYEQWYGKLEFKNGNDKLKFIEKIRLS